MARLGLGSRTLAYALVGCLIAAAPLQAQSVPPVLPNGTSGPQGEFVNRVFRDDTGDHKYVVFLPANYSAAKKWPVVLFLHGACNRGTDGRSQLVSGIAPSIRLRMSDYPFVVVFPQCENTQSRLLGGWTDQPEDQERAVKILDAVENDYSVDKNRECLVGLSMGGAGAWDIAAKSPKRWAALVVVSSTAPVADAPKVAAIPTWMFHATSDPLVPTQVAQGMVDALKAAGGNPNYTEVTKRGHDLSNVVFTSPAFTEWLLNPDKAPPQDLVLEEPKGYSSGFELEVPFVAGAEMDRAVRLRVCKDVLEAVCYAAPEKLAARPMGGALGGVRQTTTVGGFLPIDVALSGLYYQGHVEQIKITPKAPNRLILQAGLRNITMTVSNSQLNGRLLLSAKAGPMNVVIGHRAPVWLTVELRPVVQNRRVNLNLTGVDFQIPPDNWYVTQPSDVHVRGLPFLNGKVSDGLVDGIYSRKGEIERQVLNSIPALIQNLEAKLNNQILSKTVAVGQIAMPIWQPRMRTFPEEVLIDDHGVTLVSSVQISTLGQVPKDFKMRRYPAMKEFPPAVKSGLEIDVAESVVPAWTDLITAGRVNRFNTLDFAPKEYHELAGREFIQSVIPDLKRFGDDMEANVDFQLREPVRLLDVTTLEPQLLEPALGNSLTLSLPSVPIVVAIRKKGESKWTQVGELDLRIDREYAPFVEKSGHVRRGPKFAEVSPFRITSKWTYAPGYTPEILEIDEAKFVATVLRARESAQLLDGVKPNSVHDVMITGVPMRMDGMDWVKQHLAIQYQLPGILLTNDSKEPLTYEVRGPATGWSQPRTLAPGESDEYRVPYPLTWRRRIGAEIQMYTLPLGKEISFRSEPKPGMVLVNHGDLHEERVVPQ